MSWQKILSGVLCLNLSVDYLSHVCSFFYHNYYATFSILQDRSTLILLIQYYHFKKMSTLNDLWPVEGDSYEIKDEGGCMQQKVWAAAELTVLLVMVLE